MLLLRMLLLSSVWGGCPYLGRKLRTASNRNLDVADLKGLHTVGDIVVPDAKTFAIITAHSIAVVLFCKSSEAHCDPLQERLSIVASKLRATDPHVVIAMVDVSDEEKLPIAVHWNVTKFPSIKLFRRREAFEWNCGADSNAGDFVRECTAHQMVAYIQLHSQSPLEIIEAETDWYNFKKHHNIGVVGFLPSTDLANPSANLSVLEWVSNVLRDDGEYFALFGYSTQIPTRLASAHDGAQRPWFPRNFSADTVLLYKSLEDGHIHGNESAELIYQPTTSPWDRQHLLEFVLYHASPLVTLLCMETITRRNHITNKRLMYGRQRKLVFVGEFSDEPQWRTLRSRALKLGTAFRGVAVTMLADAAVPMVGLWLRTLRITEEAPQLWLVDSASGIKYRFAGGGNLSTMTTRRSKAFVRAALDGSVRPWWRSDQAPASQEAGKASVLVADTFDSVANDTSRDRLVLFYGAASTSGQRTAALLDSMVGMYGALSNMLDLIVAKFDLDANEIPRTALAFDAYPHMIYIRAGDIQMQSYSGEFNPAQIEAFVEAMRSGKTFSHDTTGALGSADPMYAGASAADIYADSNQRRAADLYDARGEL